MIAFGELDRLYIRMLRYGLPQLQSAAYSNDTEWLRAEIELLHNIPSLVGEQNVLRHLYFWESERGAYLEWVRNRGGERLDEAMAIYKPLWDEMEPLIAPLSGSGRL